MRPTHELTQPTPCCASVGASPRRSPIGRCQLLGLLASAAASSERRDPLIYDPDWDEDGRLDHFRAVVDQTSGLPPTLAAAIAADAWAAIEPLERMPWLGRLLAAALLRDRGKTSWHLSSLHVQATEVIE